MKHSQHQAHAVTELTAMISRLALELSNIASTANDYCSKGDTLAACGALMQVEQYTKTITGLAASVEAYNRLPVQS